MEMCNICRVTLDGNMITIRYLFPFQKNHEYTFSEIKEYGSVKLDLKLKPKPTNKTLFGVLRPKEGEMIRLWRSGTDRFEELDEILSGLFPPAGAEE